jgi:hypothetical protein
MRFSTQRLQAFGKAGIPGAVVVVGYDWKSGAQKRWGSLLAKLINDFAAGAAPPMHACLLHRMGTSPAVHLYAVQHVMWLS